MMDIWEEPIGSLREHVGYLRSVVEEDPELAEELDDAEYALRNRTK